MSKVTLTPGQPVENPTKEDILIGKTGIINSLVEAGKLTPEQGQERIGWALKEYQQTETPVDVIKRAFGIK